MKIGMGTGYVRYGNILAEMTIMQLNLSILKPKISKRMNLAPLLVIDIIFTMLFSQLWSHLVQL